MNQPSRISNLRSPADDGFFVPAQAARLARIPRGTLHYWRKIEVVAPSRRIVAPDGKVIEEGFSLADVGYLHLLRHLTKAGVRLEDAVPVLYHLLERFGPPSEHWRTAQLAIEPRAKTGHRRFRRVFAKVPDEWGTTLAIPGPDGVGQRAALEILGDVLPNPISLESILIPSDFLEAVEVNPRKAGGWPVARDTSVRVDVIRSLLDRMSVEEFTKEYYPHVSGDKAILCQSFDKELDHAA